MTMKISGLRRAQLKELCNQFSKEKSSEQVEILFWMLKSQNYVVGSLF